MIKQSAIVAAAREAVGTRFKHQGRTVGVALDCAGLAQHVAASVGIETTDVEGYPRTPFSGQLEATLEAQPSLVQAQDMQPGDVLLMRFDKEPQHLAIYAGETIIHAYAKARIVCEHDFTPEWRSRVVRIYRFSGVEA